MIITATPSALLAVVLLLPTVMAAVADSQVGRPVARAVLLFGLATGYQPFTLLWRAGHQMDSALAMVLDMNLLAQSWAIQAFGWLLTQTLPIAIGLVAQSRATFAVNTLKRRADVIRSEWAEIDG